jgi:hypothetical protein
MRVSSHASLQAASDMRASSVAIVKNRKNFLSAADEAQILKPPGPAKKKLAV